MKFDRKLLVIAVLSIVAIILLSVRTSRYGSKSPPRPPPRPPPPPPPPPPPAPLQGSGPPTTCPQGTQPKGDGNCYYCADHQLPFNATGSWYCPAAGAALILPIASFYTQTHP